MLLVVELRSLRISDCYQVVESVFFLSLTGGVGRVRGGFRQSNHPCERVSSERAGRTARASLGELQHQALVSDRWVTRRWRVSKCEIHEAMLLARMKIRGQYDVWSTLSWRKWRERSQGTSLRNATFTGGWGTWKRNLIQSRDEKEKAGRGDGLPRKDIKRKIITLGISFIKLVWRFMNLILRRMTFVAVPTNLDDQTDTRTRA